MKLKAFSIFKEFIMALCLAILLGSTFAGFVYVLWDVIP